jgi:hypothetical protein
MLRASSCDHVVGWGVKKAAGLTSLGLGMSLGAGSASELSRIGLVAVFSYFELVNWTPLLFLWCLETRCKSFQ